MSRKFMNTLCFLAVVLLVTAAGCTAAKSDKTAVAPPSSSANPNLVLNTPADSMSYSYGVEVARGLKKQGVEFNPDAMNQGMKDVLAGGKLLMGENELRVHLSLLKANVRAKQMKAKLNAAQDNKKDGETFLTENKTKPGVVTMPSGLQYKILKAGNGAMPTDSNTVSCYYRGTLIDGTEFDSSARGDNEGDPVPFKVSDVVAGFREALKLMPVGSKWQLFIPSNLAYGQQGTGRIIGPNATLIFAVELVAVK